MSCSVRVSDPEVVAHSGAVSLTHSVELELDSSLRRERKLCRSCERYRAR
jgi:hypothetical protein